jgi:hypothetical protein
MQVGDLVRVKEELLPLEALDDLGMVVMVDGGISKFDGEPWESYMVQWWYQQGSMTTWHENGELELISESR